MSKSSTKPLQLEDFPIKTTQVDPDSIRKLPSEEGFMEIAVELFKEAAIITALAAHTHPLDENFQPRKWQRNEAILCGLMIRISKLASAILDSTCNRRREITDILTRCLAESIINVRYLLQMNNEELFTQYVEYSLRQEKKLLNQINENIQRRGSEIPIETRMKNSIQDSFNTASMHPDNVDENAKDPWGDTMRGRAREIGLEYAYLALFGLPSHSVHGNWEDLITHHILYENGEFVPKTAWSVPRPQPLLRGAQFCVETAIAYLHHFIPECEDRTKVAQMINDLIGRINIVDKLHEEFLQRTRE